MMRKVTAMVLTMEEFLYFLIHDGYHRSIQLTAYLATSNNLDALEAIRNHSTGQSSSDTINFKAYNAIRIFSIGCDLSPDYISLY